MPKRSIWICVYTRICTLCHRKSFCIILYRKKAIVEIRQSFMRGYIAIILKQCQIISSVVTPDNSKLHLSAIKRLKIFSLYLRCLFWSFVHRESLLLRLFLTIQLRSLIRNSRQDVLSSVKQPYLSHALLKILRERSVHLIYKDKDLLIV